MYTRGQQQAAKWRLFGVPVVSGPGGPFATVAGADAQTSMADLRAAYCITLGVPLSRIGPLGHNMSRQPWVG